MNWYVKLFAPLILALMVSGLFVFSRDLGIRHHLTDDLVGLAMGIIMVYGGIQSLSFPRRKHKNRYRILLIVGILSYFLISVMLAYGHFFGGDALPSALFLAATCVITVSYYFRHKHTSDSLAPGWMQVKNIAVMGSFVGFGITWFHWFDDSYLGMANFKQILPEEVAVAFLTAWGLCVFAAVSLYYTEAIIHQIRSRPDNWDKKVNQIGR